MVISDKAGYVSLSTLPGKVEYSTLGRRMAHSSMGSDVKVQEVETTRLDDLVSETSISPGFIKVEVEGMEYFVQGCGEDTGSAPPNSTHGSQQRTRERKRLERWSIGGVLKGPWLPKVV